MGEPDIKTFIGKLKTRSEQITQDIFYSRQNHHLVKAELKSIDGRKNEACNDLTTSSLDSLEALQREFKQLVSEEKTTVSFLKEQLANLSQEKLKLEQNTILLNTRVTEVEKEVGIDISLLPVE